MKKRVLSGIQPSGKLHLGNYLGAIKQHLAAQALPDWDRYYFIASYHALTTSPEREVLRELSLEVARSYLALGLDPEKSVLFLQNDVPEVTELAWVLTCLAPMGLLQRATSYKDKIARGLAPNHGLFAYPVLQAADILVYDSHVVPVGSDQKQHLEICRDLATKFNQTYGETLVVPEAQIKEEVAVVPGIDGQKMSKSYKNTIDLFASKKQLKKQVMAIVTDTKTLEEPKDPDTCNVVTLYKLFATAEETAEMEAAYRAGNYGYGHAKLALLEKLNHALEPHREKYQYYLKHEDEVIDILRRGGKTARAKATEVMARVRDRVGLV
ncbi:MAG: tryptophan--tRNA ligase [Acidobacteriota bacterium]|nr:tryptophan--tRNA ligase [Acidobacteriota bacterium]